MVLVVFACLLQTHQNNHNLDENFFIVHEVKIFSLVNIPGLSAGNAIVGL